MVRRPQGRVARGESPYRKNPYYQWFANGTLTCEHAWSHVSQTFLVVEYCSRMFSGIHARCDDLTMRIECAQRLLVEDLGYYQGKVVGTPDHVELYKRTGDDMGHPRAVYDTIRRLPETAATLPHLRRLAHGVSWKAALCATSFIEVTTIEMARSVGV